LFGGGSTVSGHVVVFDGLGNVIDGGPAATFGIDVNGVSLGISGGTPTSVLPALSTFAWVNQGTSTAVQTVTGGPIMLTIPDNSSLNWRMLTQSTPSTPYKVSAQIRGARPFSWNVQTMGLYFYDGTKIMGFECMAEGNGPSSAQTVGAGVRKSNNTTGSGSSFNSPSGYAVDPNSALNCFVSPLWAQLRNDGTTLYLDYSVDGSNFINFYSEPMTTFITPTAIGFGGLSVTGQSYEFLAVSLLAWTLTANASL
jgi:hypothetical protein